MNKNLLTKLILITFIIIPLIMISNENMLICENLAESVGIEVANDSMINPSAIDVSPSEFLKSRWIPLPVLVIIITSEPYFDESTTMSFDPAKLVLPITLWVIDANEIWSLVLVMPLWLVGLEDEEVMLTLTTEKGTLSEVFAIKMLPFILDK